MSITPARPGIAERLSQMIQLPTVSAELDERGMGPFDEFIALLAELSAGRDIRLRRASNSP